MGYDSVYDVSAYESRTSTCISQITSFIYNSSKNETWFDQVACRFWPLEKNQRNEFHFIEHGKAEEELDEQKKKPDESQAVMDALGGGAEETAAEKDKKDKSADKHAKDAYLKETQQILADWLALQPK